MTVHPYSASTMELAQDSEPGASKMVSNLKKKKKSKL